MTLVAMVDKDKRPEDYWKNEKFVRRFTMNNVNNIRENPGANLFNITQLMATIQGIQYLCEKPTSILDVGCGHSVKSLDLKAKLGCRVVGADYSKQMLDQARNINSFLPEDRRIELHECDASKLPFEDGAFDVCTTYGLLMSLPDAQPAVNELMRVSRYGAVCIEETDDVMNAKQLESYTKVKTVQFPGRVYWHSYTKLFSQAGARTTLFSPIPAPDNWNLGSPPGYARIVGVK